MNILQEIVQAEHRIRPYIRETPLDYSPSLSQLSGCRVFLKLENLQYTGSFKVRGAMNALLALGSEQQKRGVVTASSGNHGIAIAFGLHTLHLKGSIFVPENAAPAKVAAIKSFGGEVNFYGNDGLLTEEFARAYAEQNGMVYISPYNNEHVIGGQGTIGVELSRQIDHVDVVLAAVGGGGLISGIAGYLKTVFENVRVIGCSPEHSPAMQQSIREGHIVTIESLPTLSDGTAGGLEGEAITFPLCQQFVDDYILVTEEEIREALRLFIGTQHMLIEGAAAVALASLLKAAERFQEKTVVVVLCGANIGLQTLKEIL